MAGVTSCTLSSTLKHLIWSWRFRMPLSITLAVFAPTVSSSFAVEGPSFDCSARLRQTLAVILCSVPDASKADWELSSAYWALHKDDKEGTAFGKSVTNRCSLPTTLSSQDLAGRALLKEMGSAFLGTNLNASPLPSVTSGHVRCVIEAFKEQTKAWRSKLTGDALSEAYLSPEGHIAIQKALRERGFAKNRSTKIGTNADGQFGPNTRAAIVGFQESLGIQATGFLTDDQRQALLQTSDQPPTRKALIVSGQEKKQEVLPAQKETETRGRLALEAAKGNGAQTSTEHEKTDTRMQGQLLGITVTEVTPAIAAIVGLNKPQGAFVNSVSDAAPAQAAGITMGDVILKFGDRRILDTRDLTEAVKANVEEQVNVVALRNRNEMSLTVRFYDLNAKVAAAKVKAPNAIAQDNVIIETAVQGCAKVTTECRELAVGTIVVEQNYWNNTACVLPAGAVPPCLWVNVNALSYPKGYQPVRVPQELLDQNQKERRYAGDPPLPGEPLGGSLKIQFQRGVSSGGVLRQLVSTRNTTDTDYATVAWDCSFYDREGYKTGGGPAIFHYVEKQSISFDTFAFLANGPVHNLTVNCSLRGVETVTKENARMYRQGPQSGSVRLGSQAWNAANRAHGNVNATDLPR